MDELASNKAILEIYYEDEVGCELGLTATEHQRCLVPLLPYLEVGQPLGYGAVFYHCIVQHTTLTNLLLFLTIGWNWFGPYVRILCSCIT